MNLDFCYYMPTRIIFGCGLTMLSVSYFSCLAEKNPARFPDLARAMGENVDEPGEKDRPTAFIAGLKKLIKNIGFEDKLSDFGIKQSNLKTFAENSFFAMGSLFDITPAELTLEDVVSIYENSYS